MAESWFSSFIPYGVILIYMAIIVVVLILSYKSRKNEKKHKNKYDPVDNNYYPINKYYPGTNYDKCYNHFRYRDHNNW